MESCFGGGKKTQICKINFVISVQNIADPKVQIRQTQELQIDTLYYFNGAANFKTSSSAICWSQRIINLSITFLNSRIFPVQLIF